MITPQDYRETAKENEEIFKNILKDIKDNKMMRPNARSMPKDFNIDESVDEIYKKYSEGNRNGIFTICNFTVLTKNSASIEIKNVAPLSGGGGALMYRVGKDKSVEYTGTSFNYMSFV